MYPRRTGAVPAGRLAKPVPGAASPPDPAPLRLVRVFSAYLSRVHRTQSDRDGDPAAPRRAKVGAEPAGGHPSGGADRLRVRPEAANAKKLVTKIDKHAEVRYNNFMYAAVRAGCPRAGDPPFFDEGNSFRFSMSGNVPDDAEEKYA